MRRFFRIAIRGLILLLVALCSAVAAMRLAIHGREVRVPQLVGLTPMQAQEVAISHGLILVNEGRFYSANVPVGKIMSQMPQENSKVRRGWRVRVAESLGPQRTAVPNVLGQSIHAAEINVSRRGLELGEIAQVPLPNVPLGSVLAQSPSPEMQNVLSPRVSLLTASPVHPAYVMPDFIGKHISEVQGAIEQAGFSTPKTQVATTVGDSYQKVEESGKISGPSIANTTSQAGLIIQQSPAPGAKITKETQITLEIAR